MKKRILLTSFLLLLTVMVSYSQNVDQVVEKTVKGDVISDLLKPLNEIQQLAVNNSPLLKFYDSDIIIGELKIKAEKRDWMTKLGFEAGAKYGLYDNLVITEDLGSAGSNTSTTEQTRYSLGVFLKIPLNNIADRTNVKQARAELDKIKYQKEKSEQELRQLIIVQYNNVLKASMNLEIRNKSLEMFKLQLIRSEKDFVNGKINISDYTRIHDMAVRSELEFENTKFELRTAIQVLNEIVGTNVTL
ncbi:TolC family protein [Marinifilum flexuosum]|uniref:TolC family protein n=1 Tax=Marinifilum flexuosum TaxID=1117708 RepID=UPI00248FFB20|nr:TolC family protein [Marinifilum flexuosum]